MYLICHMTSQDHRIVGHASVWMRAPFCRHCGSGEVVLVYHVILQDHVIKRSYDLIGRKLST